MDYEENLKNIGRTITNDGSEQIQKEYIITFKEIMREVPDPTDPTSPDITTIPEKREFLRVNHAIDVDESGRARIMD